MRKTGTRAQDQSVAPMWGGECEALRRPYLRHLPTKRRRNQSKGPMTVWGKPIACHSSLGPAIQRKSRSAFANVQIKTRALVYDSVGIGGSTPQACHASQNSLLALLPQQGGRCTGMTTVWNGHDAAPRRSRNESWQQAAASSA